jgi:hypothetical protein
MRAVAGIGIGVGHVFNIKQRGKAGERGGVGELLDILNNMFGIMYVGVRSIDTGIVDLHRKIPFTGYRHTAVSLREPCIGTDAIHACQYTSLVVQVIQFVVRPDGTNRAVGRESAHLSGGGGERNHSEMLQSSTLIYTGARKHREVRRVQSVRCIERYNHGTGAGRVSEPGKFGS